MISDILFDLTASISIVSSLLFFLFKISNSKKVKTNEKN